MLGVWASRSSTTRKLSRYEAWVDGELVGFAEYHLDGSRLTLTHTEVEREHERRGIGSQLAKDALTDVGARGLELDSALPFHRCLRAPAPRSVSRPRPRTPA